MQQFKRTPGKALSLLLSVLMVLSTLTVGLVPLTSAEIEHTVYNGSPDFSLKFNVPESIYLKPGSGEFAEFLTNTVKTDAIIANEQTATEYAATVVSPLAKSMTLSYEVESGKDVNGNTVSTDGIGFSIPNNVSGTTSITNTLNGCAMTGYSAAIGGNEYFIKWTLTYCVEIDGTTSAYTEQAYTTVYVPYLATAGTSVHSWYTKGGSTPEQWAYSFLVGGHKISGGNGYASKFVSDDPTIDSSLTIANAASANYPSPLVAFTGGNKHDKKENTDTPWHSGGTVPAGSAFYKQYAVETKENGGVFVYEPADNLKGELNMYKLMGTQIPTVGITVDTSRFADYNLIPNLSAGWMQFRTDYGDECNRLHMIEGQNGSSTDNSIWNGSDTKNKRLNNPTITADIDSSDGNVKQSQARGPYALKGNVVNGDNYIFFGYKNTYDDVVGQATNATITAVNLNVAAVDKQALRTAVYEAYTNAFAVKGNSSDSVKAYINAVTAGSKVLADQFATQAEVDAAKTAITNKINDSLREEIKAYYVDPTAAAGIDYDYAYLNVPETVYLTPTTGTTSTYEYALDQEMAITTKDGKHEATVTPNSGYKTLSTDSATIDFFYADVDTTKPVELYCSDSNVTFGTLKAKTGGGTEVSTTKETDGGVKLNAFADANGNQIYKGALTGGTHSNSSDYITWYVTYTDKNDGFKKSSVSKTYVYKPYASPVGAAVSSTNKRNSSSTGDWTILQALSYWEGVHNFTSRPSNITSLDSSSSSIGTYAANTSSDNGTYYIATMSDKKINGLTNLEVTTWLNATGGNGYDKSISYCADYIYQPYSRWVITSITGYTAMLYLDTSRFSNLNQIPNLKFISALTKSAKVDNTNNWGVRETFEYYDGVKDDDSTKKKVFPNLSGEDTYTVGTAKYVYNGIYNKAISADTTFGIQSCFEAKTTSGTDRWTAASTICPISVKTSSKSALRTQILAAQKLFAQNAIFYNGTSYDSVYYNTNETTMKEFLDAYDAAVKAAAKVDAVVGSEAETLQEKMEALVPVGKDVTTKQTNIAVLDGKVYTIYNSTKQKTFTETGSTRDSFEFIADSYPGYDFVGFVKTNKPVSEGNKSLNGNDPVYAMANNYKTQEVTDTSSVLTLGTAAVPGYPSTIPVISSGSIVYNEMVDTNVNYIGIYQPHTFHVIYNANTGEGDDITVDCVYGVDYTTASNTFTKQNYLFQGWNTAADGSGTTYTTIPASAQPTDDGGEIRLYAQWAVDPSKTGTITINADGKTTTGGSMEGSFGDQNILVLANSLADYKIGNQVDSLNVSDSDMDVTITKGENGYDISGTYSNSEAKDEVTLEIPLCMRLVHGKQYVLTYKTKLADKNNKYTDFYLFRDGETTCIANPSQYYFSATPDEDGYYSYELTFTCGSPDGCNDATWKDITDASGSYSMRLDMDYASGKSVVETNQPIDIKDLKITATKVQQYGGIIETKYAIENPVPTDPEYTFKRWEVSPANAAARCEAPESGDNFTFFYVGNEDAVFTPVYAQTAFIDYDNLFSLNNFAAKNPSLESNDPTHVPVEIKDGAIVFTADNASETDLYTSKSYNYKIKVDPGTKYTFSYDLDSDVKTQLHIFGYEDESTVDFNPEPFPNNGNIYQEAGKKTVSFEFTAGEHDEYIGFRFGTREATTGTATFSNIRLIPSSAKTALTGVTYADTVTPSTVKAVGDQLGDIPDEPTKEGYTFNGWYTGIGGTGDKITTETTVNGSTTYWSKFTPKQYTLTINYQYEGGAKAAEPYTAALDCDAAYSVASPTIAGYNADQATVSGNMPAADTTITVTYSKASYGVTLYANGGNFSSGYTVPTTYTYGTGLTLPTATNITKTGYTFDGWYGSSACTGTAVTSITATDTGAKEFWAKWTAAANTYKVIIYKEKLEGGYDSTKLTRSAPTASTVIVTQEDKTATGFSFKADGSVLSDTVAADGSTTLKVYLDRQTFDISFKSQDGTADLYTQSGAKYGAAIAYGGTTPTKAQDNFFTYTFAGWATETDKESGETLGTVSSAATYYAAFSKTARTYSLTLNENGGSFASAEPTEYTAGTGLILPVPTKAGYTFGGWFAEGSDTAVTEITATDFGDKSFTAKWTPANVNVKVNVYLQDVDGNYPTEASATFDAELATETVITSANAATACAYASLTGDYEFDKATNKEGTELSDTVTVTVAATGTEINMYYKLKTFTVTYAYSGAPAGTTPPTEQTYRVGQTVTPATAAELTGYTKSDWAWTETGTATAYTLTDSKMPAKDLTATATYTPIDYTITYDLDGGTVATANPTSYTIETANFTLTNPEKTGYTFAGWTGTDLSEATTTVTIAKGSTGERSYVATYTPVSYSITYNLNGGTVATANQTSYTIESDAITLNNPTKKGYTFTGWTYEGQTEPTTTVTIQKGSTGNKSYTANFSINTYNIIYNLDGGTNHADNPATYIITDADITLKAPTKTNYKFLGWYTDSAFTESKKITVIDTATAANIEIWAKFELDVANYTVEHYFMDENGAYPEQSDLPSDCKQTMSGIIGQDTAAVARTVDATEYETPTLTQAAIQSDHSTTIQIHYVRKQYNVSYQIDGAADGDPVSTYWGAEVSRKADASKTGYTFSGWTTSSEGVTVGTDGKFTMPKNDVLFTGSYTENSYTVTYKAGEGSGDDVTVTPKYTDTYTVKTVGNETGDIGFTKEGYHFIGWKDGGSNDITVGHEYKNQTADIDLTAQWEINSYTVSFRDIEDIGITSYDNLKVNHGSKVTAVPDAPSVALKVFKAWKLNVTETMMTKTQVADYVITADTKFTAIYADDLNNDGIDDSTQSRYTVTYKPGEHGAFTESSEVVLTGLTPHIPTSTPAENGWTFTNWTVDNGTVGGKITSDTVYTAQYAKVDSLWDNVTWNYHGGTQTESVLKDGTITAPAVGNYSSDDGRITYTFLGWSENSTNTVVTPADAAVGGQSYTYTAIYTPSINAGALSFTQPTKVGKTGTLTGVTAAMEYSLDGTNWTAGTGTDITVAQGATIHVRVAATATNVVSAEKTFTADEYFTVTYQTTDDTIVELSYADGQTASQSVKKGAKPAYAPTAAIKGGNAGYTLGTAWSYGTDSTTATPTDVTINGNTTFTIGYTVNSFTLTVKHVLKSNHDTVLADEQVTDNIPYTDTLTVAPVTITGYHYVSDNAPATMPAENCTVYVEYEPTEFDVIYEVREEDGTVVTTYDITNADGTKETKSYLLPTDKKVAYTSSTIIDSTVAKPNDVVYDYTDWAIEGGYTTMPAQAVKVYTVRTLHDYKVSVDVNTLDTSKGTVTLKKGEEVITGGVITTAHNGDRFTIEAEPNTGYVFCAWEVGGYTAVTTASATVTVTDSDMTFTASFSEVTYTDYNKIIDDLDTDDDDDLTDEDLSEEIKNAIEAVENGKGTDDQTKIDSKTDALEALLYTVTFTYKQVKDGSVQPTSETVYVAKGKAIAESKVPTADEVKYSFGDYDYTFKAWKNGEAEVEKVTEVSSDTDIAYTAEMDSTFVKSQHYNADFDALVEKVKGLLDGTVINGETKGDLQTKLEACFNEYAKLGTDGATDEEIYFGRTLDTGTKAAIDALKAAVDALYDGGKIKDEFLAEYNVSFTYKDADNQTVTPDAYKSKVKYGKTVTVKPSPDKVEYTVNTDGNEKHMIDKFNGWDNDVNAAITADTAFTAQYTTVDYTEYDELIDSLDTDGDGSLDDENLPEDIKELIDQIEDEKKDGEKDQTDLDGEITTLDEKIEAATHTIRFLNYDGSVLQSQELLAGKTPAYAETPVRTPTAEEKNIYYVFTGWLPAVAVVSEAKDYTAQFSKVDYTEYLEILDDLDTDEDGELDDEALTEDIGKKIEEIDENKGKDTAEQLKEKTDALKDQLWKVTFTYNTAESATTTDTLYVVKGEKIAETKVPEVESYTLETDPDYDMVFRAWQKDGTDVTDVTADAVTSDLAFTAGMDKTFVPAKAYGKDDTEGFKASEKTANELLADTELDLDPTVKEAIEALIKDGYKANGDLYGQSDAGEKAVEDAKKALDEYIAGLDTDNDGKIDDTFRSKYTVKFTYLKDDGTETTVTYTGIVSHKTLEESDKDVPEAKTVDVTKDGAHKIHKYIGWLSDKASMVPTEHDPILCDITFTAQYTTVDYTEYDELIDSLTDGEPITKEIRDIIDQIEKEKSDKTKNQTALDQEISDIRTAITDNTHTVTFMNGDTQADQISVLKGKFPKFTKAVPEKTHENEPDFLYSFTGWMRADDENLYTSTGLPAMGDENVTYTAQFEEVDYRDYNKLIDDAIYTDEEKKAVEDGKGTDTQKQLVEKVKKLKEKVYLANFRYNVSTKETKTDFFYVNKGSAIAKTKIPTVATYTNGDYDYIFTSWKKGDAVVDPSEVTSSTDVLFTAVQKKTFVKSSAYTEFEELVEKAEKLIADNDLSDELLETLEKQIKDGYKDITKTVEEEKYYGQSDEATKKVTDAIDALKDTLDGIAVDEDGKVTDESLLKHYTVKFYPYNSETDPVATLTALKGKEITVPAIPARTGDFTAVCWQNKAAADERIASEATYTVTGNADFIAIYKYKDTELKPGEIVLKFYRDGTKAELLKEETVPFGKTSGYALDPDNNPTKDFDENNHYKFTEWFGAYVKVTDDADITAGYDVIPHDYETKNATFTWNADHTACTVSCACAGCGYVLTGASCSVSSTETTATCTTDGFILYTATYGNGKLIDTYKQTTTAALGHHYVADGEGTVDETCSFKRFKCDRAGCGDYYLNLTVTALDKDGNPIEGATVTISGNGKNVTGKTDANGKFAPADKFSEGSYDVTVTYVDMDGDTAKAQGTISIGGGKASGSFGRVIGPEKFYCTMCPTYYRWKKIPVLGWFVIVIHFFVHYFQYISWLS